MTNKLQYISYLILISILINQGDGRWKERDKVELREDFMAYKRFKERLQQHIEKYYRDNPKDLLFKDVGTLGFLKESELDFFKKALQPNDTDYYKLSVFKKDTKKGKDKFLTKSSTTVSPLEQSTLYPSWPKFEDFLLSSGKKYDWKKDRWIKVKQKDQIIEVDEDDLNINYYVKHEFRYKVLKSKNRKRKNVVVVTAVR